MNGSRKRVSPRGGAAASLSSAVRLRALELSWPGGEQRALWTSSLSGGSSSLRPSSFPVSVSVSVFLSLSLSLSLPPSSSSSFSLSLCLSLSFSLRALLARSRSSVKLQSMVDPGSWDVTLTLTLCLSRIPGVMCWGCNFLRSGIQTSTGQIQAFNTYCTCSPNKFCVFGRLVGLGHAPPLGPPQSSCYGSALRTYTAAARHLSYINVTRVCGECPVKCMFKGPGAEVNRIISSVETWASLALEIRSLFWIQLFALPEISISR